MHEEIYRRIRDFLYQEAVWLDEGRWQTWLGLLDPAIRYRVVVHDVAYVEKVGEIHEPLAVIDDDATLLRIRVGRIVDGLAWSEAPRSITSRVVGNLLIAPGEESGTWMANTTTLIWKWSVVQGEGVVFGYQRHDSLIPHHEGWRILHREVVLGSDQIVGSALSIVL